MCVAGKQEQRLGSFGTRPADFENSTGGDQVGRDANVGRAGELGAGECDQPNLGAEITLRDGRDQVKFPPTCGNPTTFRAKLGERPLQTTMNYGNAAFADVRERQLCDNFGNSAS